MEDSNWPCKPDVVAREGTAATHLYWRAADAIEHLAHAEEDANAVATVVGGVDASRETDETNKQGHTFLLTVNMAGIGVSLVARLRDLARLTVRHIDLRYKAVEGGRAPGNVVVLRIEYAQIDNQSLHASLPIVLAPEAGRIYDVFEPVSATSSLADADGARGRSSAEMLYLEVELATGWEDLLHFKKFEFKLVPLTLQVEDIFIQQVMLYLEGAGLKGTRPPP